MHFEARSEERIAILSNTVTCTCSLQHAALRLHWESGCVTTKEELFHKVCFTPRFPRVVLKPNSHSGQQDQREQDARTSYDQPSEYNGIPLSTVEQQDTNRKDKAKKLIEKFETHPNKESSLQDLRQMEKINKFSKKSQVADMNNTEIFELCETPSKKQCPDCNLYWRSALFIALAEDVENRRKELRSSTRTTTIITLPVPNMDLLNDSESCTRLRKCCKKLVNPSMEDIHPYSRDGITTTHSESLCQILDGQRST